MNVKACLICLANGSLTLAPYTVKTPASTSRVHLCGAHQNDVTGKTPAQLLPIENAANATIERMWQSGAGVL